MLTKGDKILILLVTILSLFLTLFFTRSFIGYNNKMVVIKVDGKDYKKIKLDENIKEKQLGIETQFGYNLLEISKDGVRVIQASCPDGLDIKQGKISKVGQVIVCLPNRLTIEIEGSNMDEEIDKLSR